MKVSQGNINGISSVQPRLAAWEIHNVVLDSIDYVTFKGKKEDNKDKEYAVMRIRFKGEGGIYEETVFAPQEGDEKREMNSNGRENPSRLERMLYLVAHLGEVLAPERYAKIKGAEFDFPKDFEKYVNTLKKVFEKAVGQPTKLKLIGTTKGAACLPYFVNINKDGEAYMSNNFLGDKVFFTDYELTTMERRKNAKPTEMKDDAGSIANDIDVPASDTSDIDFDI